MDNKIPKTLTFSMPSKTTLSKRYLETQACVVADPEPILPSSTVPPPVSVDDPEPRSPARTVLQPVTISENCPVLIQSGSNRGQACGRPLFADNLCKRHHTLSSGDRPLKKPRLMEPVEGRCPAKTHKGSICGILLKDGQQTCKKHVSAALSTSSDQQDIVQPEPEPEPEDIRMENEPEWVVEPEPEPEPLQPPIESELFRRPEWTTHYVENSAAMLRTLQDMQVVDLDARQWEQLESKIRACFE